MRRGGGRIQPGSAEAVPGAGAGLLTFLRALRRMWRQSSRRSAARAVLPWRKERARRWPIAGRCGRLLETDFVARLLPARRAGVRVPQEDQDGGEQAGPDFRLHAKAVVAPGDVQTQHRFALTKDQFDLPAGAVQVTEHRGGSLVAGRW